MYEPLMVEHGYLNVCILVCELVNIAAVAVIEGKMLLVHFKYGPRE